MGAIASLLLALSKSMKGGEVVALPGSYGETLELIDGYAQQLHLVIGSIQSFSTDSTSRRVLLLDSCIASRDFGNVVNCGKLHFDLIIFDTTCFTGSSGRIEQVIRWSRRRAFR